MFAQIFTLAIFVMPAMSEVLSDLRHRFQYQFNTDSVEREIESVPTPDHPAAMARFIVHTSDYAALATISARPPLIGYPFANVFSISDGTTKASASGIPYMYLTHMELSNKDLEHDNRSSLTISLAQGQYCHRMALDPQDPRCAHMILSGHIVKIDKNSKEAKFAKNALFTRHPTMAGWPEGHAFYFAKLKIEQILIINHFGGAVDVPVEEYFKAKMI